MLYLSFKFSGDSKNHRPMLFKRTYTLSSRYSRDELKTRLVGDHIKIRNLDFEAIEDNRVISIFPHTEQVTEIKTLPITSIDMQDGDGNVKIVITSRIRELDLGGPQLMMILCSLLFLVALILNFAFKDFGHHLAAYIIFGVSVVILTVFWIRMQQGYFRYVRKVREHIISKVS